METVRLRKQKRLTYYNQVGAMDYRVGIMTYSQVLSEYGSTEKTWAINETVWAGISWDGGKETYEGNQEQTTQMITVRMRYRALSEEANRLYIEGEYYDIISVAPIGRKLFLNVKVQKVSTDG